MSAPQEAEPLVLRLPARLDISEAAALRRWYLDITGDAILDASGVDVLTTPCLQVMMSGRDHLAKTGHSLRITGASAAFMGCLSTLGVAAGRLTNQSGGPA
ncbi:STAS domain-containing protein [Jannaschia sp. M317]|uniref:STAS domain-containing protein n=1 Tax=Jannaschia sp. M317 TaxID=2867011 RepID=UPI0021A75DB0|nr:STAS domain-containing protein [Jannaschia sp. M317]UWQ16747.1 STAS domain-containing protein [Jannaschia sp. M317]